MPLPASPTESGGAKFVAPLVYNDVDLELQFLPMAGTNRRTIGEGGETADVLDLLIQLGTEPGSAGAGIGTTEDAAVEGGIDGSLVALVKGLQLVLGTFDDAKNNDSTLAASINARLRGLIEFAEFTKQTLGLVSDVALGADQTGSLSAHTRTLTKQIGDTTDAAVTTDANGTLAAKQRGQIVLLVNLLSRWPASLGQKTAANSLPVVLASDTGAVPLAKTASASPTNATSSATAAEILAANSSRQGVIIYNDADRALYVKYGASATTASFTVKIAAHGYWEMPQPIYTGTMHGFWEASPTGAARITEV